MEMEAANQMGFVLTLFLSLFSFAYSVTDPSDLAIINEFRKSLENSELLDWPVNGNDPCGPPVWPHIICTGNKIQQIQVMGLGLKGSLPQKFNQLSKLTNLGLQRNQFGGKLPSFSGLSELRYAFLDFNQFDSIPSDFFNGLVSLEVLALDDNPLNVSTGWSLPRELQGSAQLTNLTLVNCNLAGFLPEFLGNMSSLDVLLLSKNRLSGPIPSTFKDSELKMLWLNDQFGDGMSGSIDVISTMGSMTSLWLHGNHFSGKIAKEIGSLTYLQDLNVNSNDLVGLIPESLANMTFGHLDLNNNHFMGPIPNFKATNVSYRSNSFCQTKIGALCNTEVMALLEFLDELNYPSKLVESWSGNNPCDGPWWGLSCDDNQKVIVINLPKSNLSGTLSPSIANLDSLTHIYLGSNNISGSIPSSWTSLKHLVLLDLSNNNLSLPLPKFTAPLKLDLSGNSLLNSSPLVASPSRKDNNTSPGASPYSSTSKSSSSKSKLVIFVVPIASFTILVFLAISLYVYIRKRSMDRRKGPTSLVIHPRDPSDSNDMVKIAIADETKGNLSILTESGSASIHSGKYPMIEASNLVISVQVLRNVTKNFAPENELGRGGFGVVYKGELDDGTKIAVKRMEAGAISSKASDEFQAEIYVLSKVRHRNLVSLLGYSAEGNERILVYEYMPLGALNEHLFHWKRLNLEPLSWKRRLNIALDVARGMEYLHTLAHQCFVHRDLKSSNILLTDDFRAKVSDFGLVKLAPDGEKNSVVTRLAGTFGYLAPEYAVTGKITTKVDVFSFGVVLMELLTGWMALDEDRPNESQYLVAWFWNIKSSKEKLMAAVDPALDVKEEAFESSVYTIAELAGHCTAREPGQRPDMSHAVNVLTPLVEKWKPFEEDEEDYCGIDYSLPLDQMVKGWQETEGEDVDLEDTIPARPTGFAESFKSADGR
ncbi:receptor-like kinase TMK4 [Nicotiana tabacum]|uniref:non-specific serine/threonine protein kinase n=3 Tax=Nicotiana TaxID=4085 RepID=A0A1S3ZGP3_TOBAC|nr:PREDICTED: probable receptor protein kinase TMK1 [Nicotiana sylvestris]XP_009767612.1 PREDICTED: probable receptor protein kinase TMK1 [Nicotiana sylvestris]XP_009767613.1 PREDICTED: probable receptor protein kinase TMK1 [Nicotiana sylvestris]XP_016463623.1 PREDICTED: receptor-like kinase TMK3 [Nicotiana tabacum]XP_016463630.1 PREDICTED: receptor-like kinase TMK3 [Nicotiana tabacum]